MAQNYSDMTMNYKRIRGTIKVSVYVVNVYSGKTVLQLYGA